VIDDPRSVIVGERSVVPINVRQLQATILVLQEHEMTRNTAVSNTEKLGAANNGIESGGTVSRR
jgi:hypothetical protein